MVHTELAGPDAEPCPQRDICAELIGLDAGPTKLTTIDNAPEEWRAQFTNCSPRVGR